MPASRHILLYGPPAAGKLTVARCLASRYGVKLLDNTLTIEVALRLFDFGTEPFVGLVERLRYELVESAAGAGIDIVSTFVYAHPVDRPYVDRLIGITERGGGTMTFVQLKPPAAVLEQRAVQPSRATMAKFRDPAKVRQVLADYDLDTPIHPDDLSIDNSDIPPEEVAATIAAHADLGRML
jgi:hypothetical protein